ncbi:MAG: peptidoglycan editing factor PgeF [Rubrivivax sp.]|nr:peptidoglycan editing factor PgeF [Rubrivivax sp.]
MSTRRGGASRGAFDSLNLGAHVGDDPPAVAENRQRWARTVPGQIGWLNQVHGAQVVEAGTWGPGSTPAADAVFSTRVGQACTVLVADCLPMLLCTADGSAVAAAHAGWRGLAAGVLENTVQALTRAAGVAPGALRAWLGPCIGPQQFEVGDEVREAFGPHERSAFRPHVRSDGSRAWLGDLIALSRARLQAAGVSAVAGGHWCTVSAPSDFFSHRRDGVSGRMAAVIVRTL